MIYNFLPVMGVVPRVETVVQGVRRVQGRVRRIVLVVRLRAKRIAMRPVLLGVTDVVAIARGSVRILAPQHVLQRVILAVAISVLELVKHL